MLKRENRLTSVRLSNTKNISTPFFSLKIAKNDQSLNRFAFIVSKKIDKRATLRNLLKRKLRSCIEEIFDNMEKGYDFIFYPKSLLIKAKREEALKELKKILIKEKIIND